MKSISTLLFPNVIKALVKDEICDTNERIESLIYLKAWLLSCRFFLKGALDHKRGGYIHHQLAKMERVKIQMEFYSVLKCLTTVEGKIQHKYLRFVS